MATSGLAEEKKFYLQAGIGHVDLSNNFSDFAIAGMVDPTADATVSDPTTLIFTGGYRFRPNWSVSFTGGLPVESTASGAGSLSALGELGDIQFGVAELNLNYHFKTGSNFQPFVGLGLAYGIVFDTEDAALTDVEVGNEFGPAIRVGFDYMLNERYGVYFAASKAFLEFDVNGTATTPGGPAPGEGEVGSGPDPDWPHLPFLTQV